MLSAQSQRSCRYVLDFTSLRVFSNLRSLFSIFFLQKLTFIWLLCSDITRMDLSALIEQLSPCVQRFSPRTRSVTKYVFGFLEVSTTYLFLITGIIFLNLQQSTNLSRFCYLNNMNYFYIFSGPLKEVDLIKFQITISVCFKLDWENNGCYYTSI